MHDSTMLTIRGCLAALSFSALILTVLAVYDVSHTSLRTAPRALYDVQKIYTSQLVLLQVVVFVIDAILTAVSLHRVLATRKRRKSMDDYEVEISQGEVTTFCIKYLFVFLTKGLALLITIVFTILTLFALRDEGNTFQWVRSERNNVQSLSTAYGNFQNILIITCVELILLLLTGFVGMFYAGTTEGKLDSKV